MCIAIKYNTGFTGKNIVLLDNQSFYVLSNLSILVPTIPAGKLFDNTPLTGMESAILISVDNWAKENTDWYNTRKKLKTCLFIGIATTLIALFIEALVLLTIGSVLMILFFFLLGSSKPQPVRFPMYAGTIHNMIDWKGNYHFITKNPSYSAQFVIRQGIDDRTPHNPRNIESTDIWASGDDEFHNLSVDSFHSFIKQEKYNYQKISSGVVSTQAVNIIEQASASVIANRMIPSFEDSHFGEDIEPLSTHVDTNELSDVKGLFDWINTTMQYNSHSISKSIQNIFSEKSEYDEWVDHVKLQCEQMNAISFDSTNIGWGNSLKGLNAAQLSLEQSVAADVIAQEQTIKREMEQAEARLREKKSDFELQIAEKHEALSRSSNEISGMISAQEQTVANIKSINVAPTINLQTKYGLASGGGGSVGPHGGSISKVYSTVQTEYYDIENPAYKTLIGIEYIANGALARYNEMKKAVTTELSELNGAFQRRTDQMKTQQEERLKEIEVAKERAIFAIQKDSREVVSIQLMGGTDEENPWIDLGIINLVSWLRPYKILSDLLREYNLILKEFQNFEVQINNKNHIINSTLSLNTTGQYRTPKLSHHWVIINGNAYSEIISTQPIVFDNTSKLQIEKGPTFDYLGLTNNDISPLKLNYQNMESCIFNLVRRNAISLDVYNSLIKFKKTTLRGVLN